MRKLFSLAFLVLAFFLGWLLYRSIEEPITFADERAVRQDAVAEQLMVIRTTQEMYRDITGMFAPTFDTLKQVLREGEFLEVRILGDPDDADFDPATAYDTIYRPAIDSINRLGIDLDRLEYVPFTEDVKFDIAADTIDYQSTKVPVVQVGIPYKEFMGRFADARFQRYDQRYNPNAPIKFGDLSKPSLAGNWE
ncbi:hypothetical protein CLV84_1209 [Neolewinella xylanilytica]|uniref:Uncharacterized protein n=1 Tax=Neolewinella xylanilytica TaxID=1514080 RepID=A0A2S6I9R7_9BACT|nr:hypothetical protein [Neolewinella xylanilytica]PPK88244.1 hypothetical protein CLV84_1209 [Neolewinella xylanilytica]